MLIVNTLVGFLTLYFKEKILGIHNRGNLKD
jgi:hypothetical protein